MSARTYSVVVISDELLLARLRSLDEWELMGRIGPLCQNALQAKGMYERAMMQRERSAEAIIANHKAMAEVRGHLQVRPLLPSLWPLLVLFAGIGWCLGVLTERVLA